MPNSARRSSRRACTVADVVAVLDRLAPPALAQPWDNVGLLAGDPGARVRRTLLCIDLTPAVVAEAIRKRVQLVFAYHPPIFKPVSRLSADSRGTDAAVFRCIEARIAVYSSHTALDAAEGGTNDALAALCGIRQTQPLEWMDAPGARSWKVVTFVPAEQTDRVAEAMFRAGAGQIGEYSRCSFRSCGEGTFLGGQSTHPAVGSRGTFEKVTEIRLEVVVCAADLPAVMAALRSAHPYEEPAFDIYPLALPPARGLGRCGGLPRPVSLRALGTRLARLTASKQVSLVGEPQRRVQRAVILVGAAGDLPIRALRDPADVIITGEIRHHDALAIRRRNASAIALGHWASERPVLGPLAGKLAAALPDLRHFVSRADSDPFQPV